MDYGDLLTRGFSLVWKNKFMVLLGLLAALGASSASSGGGGGVNFQQDMQEFIEATADPTSTDVPEVPLAFKGLFDLIELFSVDPAQAWAQVSGGYLPLILIGLLLGIVFFVVRTGALAALIKSAVYLDDKEEDSALTLTAGVAFRDGMGYFGRLFGLAILGTLISIVPLVVFIASIGGLVGFAAAGGGEPALGILFPLLCLIICVLVPLMFVWSLVQPFAFRGIVLEDLGVFKSIGHGWRIFKKSAGEIIVMGIIFFIIGMIFTTVVGIVLGLVGFLFGGEVVLEFLRTGVLTTRQGLILAVGGLLGTLMTAILMSVFRAWQSTTVTLGYKNFWRERAMGTNGDDDLALGT